jgi:hydroxymethylpyrimidine/phosphomethylpyrimidine kinase
VDPDLVRAQIEAVASDLSPRAIKSGMLANAAIIHAVAAAIRANHSRLVVSAGSSSRPARRPPGSPLAANGSPAYVLDPVMVASSGVSLLEPDAVATLRRVLLPLADLVTPNMSEAAALVGESVTDLKGMERAARLLVDREGVRAALVTGGHLAGPYTVDVLYDGGVHYFRNSRIATHDTHGTGCTLSAAIVAHLALGKTLRVAIREGIRYVRHALRRSLHLSRPARLRKRAVLEQLVRGQPASSDTQP